MSATRISTRTRRPRAADASLMPAAMHRHADAAIEMLKAIGNRNRLLLLCQLVGGERAVGDLAESLGLSQSVVSQHLALLRHDGIVSPRREAQSIYYRISDARATALMRTLYALYCQ